MEVAVRALNLLLIFVFVFQGLCAVPGIGKRHPQAIIPEIIPKVDPIPIPIPIPRVDPIPIPIPKVDPIPGSNVPSLLGEYIDNYHQAPFSDLTGEWDPFFSRVDDILEAAETDVANKPKEPGGGPPGVLPAGTPRIITYTITDFWTPVGGGSCTIIPTYITVFDPTQPTNACSAWSSLSVYCSGGGTNCACYSGSYYVPDQWNSLAAACAKAVTDCPPLQPLPSPPLSSPVPPLPPSPPSPATVPHTPPPLLTVRPLLTLPPPLPSPATVPHLPPPPPTVPPSPSLPTLPHAPRTALKAENAGLWCDLVLSASSYASYCPTNTSTVAFAAVTPKPTGSAATAIEVPKFKILTTALFLVLSAYRIW